MSILDSFKRKASIIEEQFDLSDVHLPFNPSTEMPAVKRYITANINLTRKGRRYFLWGMDYDENVKTQDNYTLYRLLDIANQQLEVFRTFGDGMLVGRKGFIKFTRDNHYVIIDIKQELERRNQQKFI